LCEATAAPWLHLGEMLVVSCGGPDLNFKPSLRMRFARLATVLVGLRRAK